MNYHVCPGVVLTEVCGEYLLVATKEARGKVPYAKGMNDSGAYFWNLFSKRLNFAQIVEQTVLDHNLTKEEVEPMVRQFMDALAGMGYLIWEEDVP